jgi:hypothetical protein
MINMKKDELLTSLEKNNVPRQMYSFGELGGGECYSVLYDGEGWKVLYLERGKVLEIQSGLSEEEAYEVIYMEFKNLYGWA